MKSLPYFEYGARARELLRRLGEESVRLLLFSICGDNAGAIELLLIIVIVEAHGCWPEFDTGEGISSKFSSCTAGGGNPKETSLLFELEPNELKINNAF